MRSDVKIQCTSLICTLYFAIFGIFFIEIAESFDIVSIIQGGDTPVRNGSELGTEWDPEGESFINLPVEECDAKDVVNQTDFAELRYLNMHPLCEETSNKGYCGIRRRQNITLVAKFIAKQYAQQYRLQIHLVDKNFGFETAVWPEFGVCNSFFNFTCPQEPNQLVHPYVFSELPKELIPHSAIVRVRLVSINEKQRNVAICRQIKLQVL